MIEKNISHYRIVEKLGEGRMGVVYKARYTKLDRIVALILVIMLSLLTFELSVAKREKTGRMEGDTLIDERFGYQLKALSNWGIQLEKEPSLVRIILKKKNYRKEARIIPTVTILADTTSLSLQQIENSLIKGKGDLRNRNEYLLKLEVLADYELLDTAEITLDSIPGKMYGLRREAGRWERDPTSRYVIGGWRRTRVMKVDFLLGVVVIVKKGVNLYIIQLCGEYAYFWVSEKEFSNLLKSWKFLK